jgi:ribosomal protein S18 acetylase RimI-like enzyme
MELITFRPTGPDDEDFLLKVYGSTRAAELSVVPWTDEQRKAFLQMQLNAQHHHYRQLYPQGDYLIILDGDRAVGRLYTARLKDQLRIMDITVLPEERRRGIGTSILRDLMAEAAATAKPLRIYVESFNPSLRLFERLGFSKIEEEGIHLLMEWREGASIE